MKISTQQREKQYTFDRQKIIVESTARRAVIMTARDFAVSYNNIYKYSLLL